MNDTDVKPTTNVGTDGAQALPRLTQEQAAIIGAYTGYSAGGFGDIHEYAERVLGRPVWTHQFADPAVVEELRAASKADFLSICYAGEGSVR
jgi:hypothetical protein